MFRYLSDVRWQDRITNEEVRRRFGVENLEHRLRKMRLRWFGHVKHRDVYNILTCRRAMELKVEARRPVDRPKKTWSKVLQWKMRVEARRPVGRPKNTWGKVVEEDMRKLKVTEDMAEDRHQWRRLISHLTPGVGNQGR